MTRWPLTLTWPWLTNWRAANTLATNLEDCTPRSPRPMGGFHPGGVAGGRAISHASQPAGGWSFARRHDPVATKRSATYLIAHCQKRPLGQQTPHHVRERQPSALHCDLRRGALSAQSVGTRGLRRYQTPTCLDFAAPALYQPRNLTALGPRRTRDLSTF